MDTSRSIKDKVGSMQVLVMSALGQPQRRVTVVHNDDDRRHKYVVVGRSNCRGPTDVCAYEEVLWCHRINAIVRDGAI